MNIRLTITNTERTVIVAALKEYSKEYSKAYDKAEESNEKNAFDKLAQRIAFAPFYDPADDGPEVEILRERIS